jgi:rsbT co-antagonist protein RsbR
MVIALALMVVDVVLLPLTLQPSASSSGRFVLFSGILFQGIVFLLARSGRVTLAAWLLIAFVLAGILSSMLATRTVSFSLFYLALTLLVASLILRPGQIWLVLLTNLIGIALIVTRMPISPWADETSRTMLVGAVVFLVVVGLISFLGASSTAWILRAVRQARSQVEASAAALARNNAGLEAMVAERTIALQTALSEVEHRAAEQAQLLAENEQQRSTIHEMSVPVIPVTRHTLVMPLIGALDTSRLRLIQEQALRAIERTSAHTLILDITGVSVVDSQVAYGVLAVMQATRLLGTTTLLVGVRPEVAQAIVGLGLDLESIRTYTDLASALDRADQRSRPLPTSPSRSPLNASAR